MTVLAEEVGGSGHMELVLEHVGKPGNILRCCSTQAVFYVSNFRGNNIFRKTSLVLAGNETMQVVDFQLNVPLNFSK